MTTKELKDIINAIPEDFDDYSVTTSMSDYDVEASVRKVSNIIYMDTKTVNIHITR